MTTHEMALEASKVARMAAESMIKAKIQWALDPNYIITLCDAVDSRSTLLSGDSGELVARLTRESHPFSLGGRRPFNPDGPEAATLITAQAAEIARLREALKASDRGGRATSGWNTDTQDMAAAVSEFETALPGFWWSVGQCSVGAHASCAVDGSGSQAELLEGIEAGHPFDSSFHCDTTGGSPAEALRDVTKQAVEFLARRQSSEGGR